MSGGRALCDALRTNTTLTELDLSGSDVMLETLQSVGTLFGVGTVVTLSLSFFALLCECVCVWGGVFR